MFLDMFDDQRGCKVVTYRTSVEIKVLILPTCLRSLFIHSLRRGGANSGLLKTSKSYFIPIV